MDDASARAATRHLDRWIRSRIAALVAVLLLAAFAAAAAAPPLVSYQGQLLDASGAPRNGAVTLHFRILTDPVAGASLWEETHPSVPVVDGVFQVLLGSVTPLDPALLASGAIWLEVDVDGETLAPRQPISSVPFALRAQGAEQLLQACADGEVLRHLGGSWQCSTVQGCAVSVLCPAGQFMRGCDAAGSPICAAPPAPISVIASANPTTGVAPLAVAFGCEVAGANPPLLFVWAFGDGVSMSTRNPNYSYNVSGEYTATCTVTGADGNQGIGAVSVQVVPDLAPEASPSATPSSGITPLQVSFGCAAGSGNPPYTFYWEFGDGGSSSLQSPSHVYSAPGTYGPFCAVTDADGDLDLDVVVVEVAQDTFPNASVFASPSSGQAPLQVSFSCPVAGGNPPLSFAWEFGNGATSSLQNPSFVYADAGIYTATCTVTDVDGDLDIDNASVSVSAPP